MRDYTWPSVYFAYLFFALCAAMAVYFFLRSWKDGYWGPEGEEVKFQIFENKVTQGKVSHGTDQTQD